MLLLPKKEKVRIVIQLAKEGKTTREIAKRVHISLKDIGKIIRDYMGEQRENEQEKQISSKKPSLESMAFRMFKEGKSNVDVAILLDLQAEDVISLRHDFLRLSNLNDLITLHKILGKDLPLLIQLFQRMKNEGILTKNDIVKLVNSEVQLRDLRKQISNLYDEVGRMNGIKIQLRDEIAQLKNESF